MKNTVKKALFIMLILIILFSINTKVFAWDSIVDQGKDFIQAGESYQGGTIKDTTTLQKLSSYLYNILLAAGIVIAVIVATVLGIQFMMGGAEGQAKVKEMLVPFIVGCVVVFGGFGFWKIAITVGQRLEASDSSSGGNQFDFSERTCKSCGKSGIPTFDIDKHTYVCPYCGTKAEETGDKSDSSNNQNQYDFSEKNCQSCGKKGTPKYDIDKHTYVCPYCGTPSGTGEGNQYDFSEKNCQSCGKNGTPKYDIDKQTYVCPYCGTAE